MIFFSEQELFPKLCNVLKEIPHVKTIIVYEEPHKGRIPSLPDGVDVTVKTFNEVIELGQSSQVRALLNLKAKYFRIE